MRCGPLTLHTETAMYMSGLLTNATFSVAQATVANASPTAGGAAATEAAQQAQSVVIECRGVGYSKSRRD
jgi:hypothetical protein